MNYKNFAKGLVKEGNGIIAAYGYGSAFSHQSGYTDETKKSLDMLFIVASLKEWYAKNYRISEGGYSKYTKAVFKIAPKKFLLGGTSVIYNVVAGSAGQDFKYGLIERDRFIVDMYSWEHFYVCGRTQKPMYTIKYNQEINDAIKFNRKLALLVSLMILNKEVLSINELLEQICRLSYDGDVRTLFVENPNKIKNIVNGNLDGLKKLYLNNEYVCVRDDKVYVDLNAVYGDYYLLPLNIFKMLGNDINEYGSIISKYLKGRNLIESMAQPSKQLLVTGLTGSRAYMKAKLSKKNIK